MNHICDSTTAVPGSQINLPNVDKDGVESVILTYTETNPDGSKTKWVCVDTQRMADMYNACHDRVNAKPKFNLGERCVFRAGTRLTVCDQMLCMPESKIAFYNPDVAEPIKVDSSDDNPGSPTATFHNPFG